MCTYPCTARCVVYLLMIADQSLYYPTGGGGSIDVRGTVISSSGQRVSSGSCLCRRPTVASWAIARWLGVEVVVNMPPSNEDISFWSTYTTLPQGIVACYICCDEDQLAQFDAVMQVQHSAVRKYIGVHAGMPM